MELKLELKLTQDLSETYKKSLANLSELQEQSKDEETKGLTWFNWPEQGGFDLLSEIQEKKDSLAFYYDLIVVVGIGGSYLGAKAINDLFGVDLTQESQQKKRKPILFIGNNLSENYLLKNLTLIKQHSPVFCVVSKSGTTVEPLAAYSLLEEQMTSYFSKEELAERTFIITDQKENNPLLNKSKEEKTHLIHIPKEMGGRFSVLSAASLVPLALAGHKVKSLMQGSQRFFQELNSPQDKKLAVAEYASARFLTWEQGKRIELLAYNEPSLGGLASWWQQLFAESEGKKAKGLFPTTSLYSTDLHSLGQYLQEGCPSIFETFLLYEDHSPLGLEEAETRLRIPSNLKARALLGDKCGHYFFDLNQKIMTAAQKAHEKNDIPYCKITLPKLTEMNLGYLLSFFQTACALSAMLLEVNPFDQPGVEIYKRELQQLTMS